MSEKMDLETLKIQRPKRTYQKDPGGVGSWAGWLVLLLVFAAFLHPRSPATIWGPAPPPSVEVLRISRNRPRTNTVKGMAANGHIVAARRAALSADTPGRIVELTVTEGSTVHEGEVVARLYSDEYAASLERARAAERSLQAERLRALQEVAVAKAEHSRLRSHLAAARAETQAREAERSLAELEAARAEKLAQRGASDQRELDRTRSLLQSTRARRDQGQALEQAAARDLELATQRITLAETQIEVIDARRIEAQASITLAAATLEKTLVRAPFTGIVVLKDAEVGEVVSPNVSGGASSRGAIVTMVDPNSLEVQAEVPETRLRSVRLGGPVRVFLDSDPERPHPGVVSRIWPTANLQKATIEVRVRLQEAVPGLRPEMGVRAVFLPEEEAGTPAPEPGTPAPLEIPESCLRDQAGRRGVWLEVEGRARFRSLNPGASRRGMVPVPTGLQEGERVILRPPADLAEGSPVRVQDS